MNINDLYLIMLLVHLITVEDCTELSSYTDIPITSNPEGTEK